MAAALLELANGSTITADPELAMIAVPATLLLRAVLLGGWNSAELDTIAK